MPTTIIDLLRHGELEGGVRYRGNIEEALTDAGRSHMDDVWRHLREKVEIIATSPLGRCREPAEAWAKHANIPCHIEPRLCEMHYGAWEGLNKEEIEQQFPGWLARWRENPVGMEIPGAERVEAFAERVVEGWEALLKKHAGKHVLVVGHSGTLRVILAHVLGAPLPTIRRLVMPYGSWIRVLHDNGHSYLEYLNRKP